MQSSTFYQKNKAYILTLVGLGVVGFIFVMFMMIMDWAYIFHFVVNMLSGGGLSGVVTPSDSGYEDMVNTAFGQNYKAIAPEIIRASNERQEFIWWVFIGEIAIFCFMYAKSGRQTAVIANPDDQVQVFSLFHRAIIWLNVLIILVLIVTGFNITWGLRSGGGDLAFFLRGLHEMTGIFWLPFWLILSIVAFKDAKLLFKNSVLNKLILPGKYKPMKRVIYIAFVTMGAGLLTSGIIIWFIHPDAFTHGQYIQFKRLLLYVHFGSSVLIMFFLMDFVYSVAISVKGNIKGLITGKYPREHLQQLAPDVLEDISSIRRN